LSEQTPDFNPPLFEIEVMERLRRIEKKMSSSPSKVPDRREALRMRITMLQGTIGYHRDEMSKAVDRLGEAQEELLDLEERAKDEMDRDMGGGPERVPKP